MKNLNKKKTDYDKTEYFRIRIPRHLKNKYDDLKIIHPNIIQKMGELIAKEYAENYQKINAKKRKNKKNEKGN